PDAMRPKHEMSALAGTHRAATPHRSITRRRGWFPHGALRDAWRRGRALRASDCPTIEAWDTFWLRATATPALSGKRHCGVIMIWRARGGRAQGTGAGGA